MYAATNFWAAMKRKYTTRNKIEYSNRFETPWVALNSPVPHFLNERMNPLNTTDIMNGQNSALENLNALLNA
jgi:hypothetical protein